MDPFMYRMGNKYYFNYILSQTTNNNHNKTNSRTFNLFHKKRNTNPFIYTITTNLIRLSLFIFDFCLLNPIKITYTFLNNNRRRKCIFRKKRIESNIRKAFCKSHR